MQSARKFLLGGILACLGASCPAGTISGNVKSADGTPFRGAFVQAQNSSTKITLSVLSDKEGRYRLEALPAGNYQVQAKATGFKTETRSGVALTANENASADFSLQKGNVRWA